MMETRTVEEVATPTDTTPTDRGRLETLYARYAPDAARLAYLLTGDRALAEDIVQDAFVRMFGRFRDLRNPDAFGSYLRTTVVNLTRSYFRRRGVEHTFLEKEAREPGKAAEQPDPQHEMWTALKRVTPRQRAAIVLRFYEDLSEAQTAHILGCAVGTVKSLVSRGLKQLREDLRDGERHG
jgi:RNA polymerase sigma-70 factor (sigma-E family)